MQKQLLSRSFSTSNPIKKVGMVGMGLMGHGIAQTAAQAGYQVLAVDVNDSGLQNGMQMIEKSLQKVVAKKLKTGKLESEAAAKSEFNAIMDRISPSSSLSSLTDADLVIEAIVEDVDVKIPFYKELGSIVKPSGILASNTSSLPISVMAEPSGRPSNVVGLHFFNPVQMMKLVEVVKTSETNPAVFDTCKDFVASIGKTAVSCKDTPGFIVNRLLVPSLAQALLMLERGDASMEDIDISMQLGAGHPMGPITLADYVGLDTILSIVDGWVTNFPNEPAFVVPEILRQKVAAGHLGRKSGQGFYKWDGGKRL